MLARNNNKSGEYKTTTVLGLCKIAVLVPYSIYVFYCHMYIITHGHSEQFDMAVRKRSRQKR